MQITKGEFTSEMCDKVHGADTSALTGIMCFACMLCPTLTLPKELMNNIVCSRVLNLRYVAVGSRLTNFEKCISTIGVINWLLACAFEFKWAGKTQDSGLQSIRYRYSQHTAIIPAHYIITDRAYTLQAPCLDWMGMFSDGGASNLKLCDFFTKDKTSPTGPWRFPYDKACKFFKDDMESVKLQMEREAAAAASGQEAAVELTIAAEAATTKRKQTSKKARDALEKDQNSTKGLKLRRTESLE